MVVGYIYRHSHLLCFRSGYGTKHGQTSVLKVKLSHAVVAELLNECACKHGGGGLRKDSLAPTGALYIMMCYYIYIRTPQAT